MIVFQVPQSDSPQIPDLSRLLRAIGKEDAEALEALYHTCRKSVLAMAYAITRDRQHAEDVLQETMLYIWTHADRFRFGCHPKLWIGTITRHLAIDLVRKKHPWVTLEGMEDEIRDGGAHHSETVEDTLTLWDGIRQLEPLEAQVFVCKAMIGLAHAETARLLSLSYRSVHYQYRKAIAKLRIALSDRDFPERGM